MVEAAMNDHNIKLPQDLIDYVGKEQEEMSQNTSQGASGSQYGYSQHHEYQNYYTHEVGQAIPYNEDSFYDQTYLH